VALQKEIDQLRSNFRWWCPQSELVKNIDWLPREIPASMLTRSERQVSMIEDPLLQDRGERYWREDLSQKLPLRGPPVERRHPNAVA
jgi:hypothetical protein